jgi:hypothetical protein
MPSTTRTIAGSLAVLLVAGAMAPATANAWPLGKKTSSDPSAAKSQGPPISFQVYNRGKNSQDIRVAGQVYTVPSQQTITLTAAPGAEVYADSEGNGYQKGTLLFTIIPTMKGAKVSFN